MNHITMYDLLGFLPHWRQKAARAINAVREYFPAPAMIAFGLLFAMLLIGSNAHAVTPAGTTIGNQASATYSDGTATLRTVTSNAVVTTITQVGSATLVANNAKTVSISGQVYYPHTLTNSGNGTDTFALSQTNTGSFLFTTALIYPDADGDGTPDNLIPITSSGPLAAGQVFKFVVAGIVPATATSGNTNAMVVKALSAFNAAQVTVTDNTTITGQAVMNVTQALDVTTGPSPSTSSRTVTITYTNTGNTTATGLVLAEAMPSGFTYVPASARWSVTGAATTLTDAANEDQGGIAYIYDTPSSTLTATIASIPAGTTGTLTYKVNVASGLAPGANAATASTATYAYNDGAAAIAAANANTVQYTVVQAAAVTLSTPATVTAATQGGTVSFTHVLTNTGNGTDSFDLTTNTSTFPAGTVFQFYRPDGVTPLLDTNGNVFPDSGPLAAGAAVNVVVKAILPPGSTGGPFTVNVTATSKFNSAVTASATDTLTAITANSVDLTNSVAGVISGAGAGPEGTAALTQTVAPGGTTRFTLVVNNAATVADSFGLQASTDVNFASQALPAGWTVNFTDGSAGINGTGVINASGSKTVYADVTVPAGTTASTTDLYFRVLSPTTGASDRLHDAVIVGTLRTLTLSPDQSGQVVAGGTKVYAHMIVNNGTVTEGAVAGSALLSTTDATTGFSSIIYWDKNNDGLLDANDPVVGDLSALTGGTNGANTIAGLAPAASARLFVKVTAPAGAAIGTADITKVNLTISGVLGGIAAPGVVVATDNSQVVASQVTLLITQALDALCNGTLTGTYSVQAIANAQPGQCIRYTILATNTGSSPISSLTVFNATPAYTTYHGTVPAAASAGTVTAPTNGSAGTVQTVVGNLAAGGIVTLTYGARITP